MQDLYRLPTLWHAYQWPCCGAVIVTDQVIVYVIASGGDGAVHTKDGPLYAHLNGPVLISGCNAL